MFIVFVFIVFGRMPTAIRMMTATAAHRTAAEKQQRKQ